MSILSQVPGVKTTRPDREKALDDLEYAVEQCAATGMHVRCVVVGYSQGTTEFHTLVKSQKDAPPDHVLLDCLRELLVDWSNINHRAKLHWTEGPFPDPAR